MSVQAIYDPKAPKRAVNLNLNGDLVAKARAERLNLSSIAEAAIGGALAQAAEVRFRREIALSVAEHAAYLEEYGSLGDAVRAMGPGDGASF